MILSKARLVRKTGSPLRGGQKNVYMKVRKTSIKAVNNLTLMMLVFRTLI